MHFLLGGCTRTHAQKCHCLFFFLPLSSSNTEIICKEIIGLARAGLLHTNFVRLTSRGQCSMWPLARALEFILFDWKDSVWSNVAEAPCVSFKINGWKRSLSVLGLRPAADMSQECLSGDLRRFKENTWPLYEATMASSSGASSIWEDFLSFFFIGIMKVAELETGSPPPSLTIYLCADLYICNPTLSAPISVHDWITQAPIFPLILCLEVFKRWKEIFFTG